MSGAETNLLNFANPINVGSPFNLQKANNNNLPYTNNSNNINNINNRKRKFHEFSPKPTTMQPMQQNFLTNQSQRDPSAQPPFPDLLSRFLSTSPSDLIHKDDNFFGGNASMPSFGTLGQFQLPDDANNSFNRNTTSQKHQMSPTNVNCETSVPLIMNPMSPQSKLYKKDSSVASSVQMNQKAGQKHEEQLQGLYPPIKYSYSNSFSNMDMMPTGPVNGGADQLPATDRDVYSNNNFFDGLVPHMNPQQPQQMPEYANFLGSSDNVDQNGTSAQNEVPARMPQQTQTAATEEEEQQFKVRELASQFGFSKDATKHWRFRDLKRSLLEKMSADQKEFIENHPQHSLILQRLPHKLSKRQFCKRIILLVFNFILRDGKEPKFWSNKTTEHKANVEAHCRQCYAENPDEYYYYSVDFAKEVSRVKAERPELTVSDAMTKAVENEQAAQMPTPQIQQQQQQQQQVQVMQQLPQYM